jgi:hypothetical protein
MFFRSIYEQVHNVNFLVDMVDPEIRYCLTSTEMSSLYVGIAVFCLLEAGVLEFDKQM